MVCLRAWWSVLSFCQNARHSLAKMNFEECPDRINNESPKMPSKKQPCIILLFSSFRPSSGFCLSSEKKPNNSYNKDIPWSTNLSYNWLKKKGMFALAMSSDVVFSITYIYHLSNITSCSITTKAIYRTILNKSINNNFPLILPFPIMWICCVTTVPHTTIFFVRKNNY